MSDVIASLDFSHGRSFTVEVLDLLTAEVDAIVNAANGYLAHGAGVAEVISRAAGPALDEEGDAIVRARGPIPTGEAVVTTAGRLPFRGVIHAVGPCQGEGDEEARLTSALANALLRAHERGWTSLAFPAVSAGIFAVPLDVCARAYVRAVREFFAAHPDTPLRAVRLALLERGPLSRLVAEQVRA